MKKRERERRENERRKERRGMGRRGVMVETYEVERESELSGE